MPGSAHKILDDQSISRALSRMAHEIVEHNHDIARLGLVGIQTGGVHLAGRLKVKIKEIASTSVSCGVLDIGMHRDDIGLRGEAPMIKKTDIPFDITRKTIVLVDDVLFTGRSIRAAMDALMDFGRPQRIQLAVLIDRGHRELPIRADYVGKNVPTTLEEKVRVKLKESGGVDEVITSKKGRQS